MPTKPEPSNESERLYPVISEEEKGPFLDEVREHLVWEKVWRERRAAERLRRHAEAVREAFVAEDAYRNKLRRERLARERQAAEEEGRPAKPGA
jgi:hypothetical protein